MAFNDTLFQLGMDLTRSSTTQAEDFVSQSSLSGSAKVRESQSSDRDGVRFEGTHLVIDLFGAKHLDDLDIVEAALVSCVEASGAASLHNHLHQTMPGQGINGVAVLRDGHISVHTAPAAGYAAFDVFLSGHVKAHVITGILRRAFEARDVSVKEQKRGDEADLLSQTKRSPVRFARATKQPRVAAA